MLLDIGPEILTVDRPIEDARDREPVRSTNRTWLIAARVTSKSHQTYDVTNGDAGRAARQAWRFDFEEPDPVVRPYDRLLA